MAWHSELETQQVRPVTCHQILQNYDSKLYTAMNHEIPSECNNQYAARHSRYTVLTCKLL